VKLLLSFTKPALGFEQDKWGPLQMQFNLPLMLFVLW